MSARDPRQANKETRDAWNQNAAFWDERMGEGNDFVELLIWPASKRMLDVRPGERVLDIACGNGLYARRLAALGAEVVAFDFAGAMIEQARKRTTEHAERITYLTLDATDETALLALGEGQFDAALCSMALFDMAEIAPLMRALARLLGPAGRFVFSVMHPCFNNPRTVHVAEMRERGAELVTSYSIQISDYIHSSVDEGMAIRGQPRAQLIFHRPLHVLLGAGFDAGFVLDALEEPAFPADHPPGRNPLAWSGLFQIPPVLVARLIPRSR